MCNCIKGFVAGMAIAAAVFMMLPNGTERKLRRSAPARAMRRYGERAYDMFSDMLP